MIKKNKNVPTILKVEDSLAQYLPSSEGGQAHPDVIQHARKGVSMSYLLRLARHMGISLQELAEILHVSLRTVQRYSDEKVLDTDLSSKAILLASLHKKGVQVFGSDEAFSEWLRTPVPVLDGNKPISFLDTPFGFQLLHQVLGRIEHGVFA